jgi:8-oxo-(d)GTP phosphatase
VVWRPAGRGTQVLLVHRPKYDDWSFAKGKLERGEHALLAAVREAEEETGLRVTLGRRLPPVHYAASGSPKRVDYWAATVEREAAEFTPNREIDELAWVAAAAAGARLSYQRDIETLAAFRAGPRRTVPLILLRHASAGSKDDWPGDEMHRPLDTQGTQEAAVLADLLRCFGVSRVLSAPAERCVATVRPYAAAVGTEIEVEPAFDVVSWDGRASWAGASSAGEKTAAELVAVDQPAIICAHRENMPVLLAAACAALGASAPATSELRKGEFVVLHRARGVLAAIESYHPEGALAADEHQRGSWQARGPGAPVRPADPWAASQVSAAARLRV